MVWCDMAVLQEVPAGSHRLDAALLLAQSDRPRLPAATSSACVLVVYVRKHCSKLLTLLVCWQANRRQSAVATASSYRRVNHLHAMTQAQSGGGEESKQAHVPPSSTPSSHSGLISHSTMHMVSTVLCSALCVCLCVCVGGDWTERVVDAV